MAELDRTIIDDTGFIKLPVGTTAQRPNSPEIGMMRWNTDEEYVEFYNGAEWIAVESGGGFTPESLGNVTGNDYQINGTNYRSFVFTSGTTFTLDGDIKDAELVIIAGGGAGGDGNANGGAGGAGGVLISQQPFDMNAGNYSLTIGAGGTGVPGSDQSGSNGQNTTLDTPQGTLTAIGGGRGGSYQNSASNGGSGGGDTGPTNSRGIGVSNQTSVSIFGITFDGLGNSGGPTNGTDRYGGGGGGAGGAGGDGNAGGAGGQGITLDWENGNNIGYAGGGSGGRFQGNGSTQDNTFYGGGRGSYYPSSQLSQNEWNGRQNSGGGGGGSADKNTGHEGGSGICILRFPI